MKKIKVLSLFLVIVLTLAMFAGCGKKDKVDNSESTTSTTETSQTLESFLKSNNNYMKQVENSGDENMTVDIKGNTIVYIYDFSKMEGIDEATATSMKENLDNALDQYGSTFSGLCDTLESATKIDGIKILVKYVYKDVVISEKEFEAN